MQPTQNQHLLFTAANYEGVFEIDNSFQSRLAVESENQKCIYLNSHVVTQRYTVGGSPQSKVNVFDNETKQVVYKSSKNMIGIQLPKA